MKNNKSQTKVYNRREAVKILKQNGYEERTRKSGSGHVDFVNEAGNKIVLTNKLNRMVWQRLVKENGLKIA